MKKDCSLFKQKGLTINKKEKNLNSLKNTQLDFKSLADMENLEGAETCRSRDGKSNDDDDECIRKDDGNDIWPPDLGQFVFGLF